MASWAAPGPRSVGEHAMNFDLAVEERQIRSRALALAREEIAPSAIARDRESRWEPGLFRTMAGEDMLGAPWTRELGGRGCTMRQACLMLEGAAEGAQDAGLGAAWVSHTFSCGLSIARFAHDAERVSRFEGEAEALAARAITGLTWPRLFALYPGYILRKARKSQVNL